MLTINHGLNYELIDPEIKPELIKFAIDAGEIKWQNNKYEEKFSNYEGNLTN